MDNFKKVKVPPNRDSKDNIEINIDDKNNIYSSYVFANNQYKKEIMKKEIKISTSQEDIDSLV